MNGAPPGGRALAQARFTPAEYCPATPGSHNPNHFERPANHHSPPRSPRAAARFLSAFRGQGPRPPEGPATGEGTQASDPGGGALLNPP
ncbi:hypothetical protein GCM10010170_088020 [Dactylosporangium salmoneum]|uniref:Uncharacterized protein n=1 Tax=Dactylosporangium salmoneum TaxID=53361 RepID=A0ABN3HHS9_9ACTN